MIRSLQLKTFGLYRPSAKILTQLSYPAPAATRASSLSAIHRGLRRSEKAQYGESRPSSVTSGRRRDGESYNERSDSTRYGESRFSDVISGRRRDRDSYGERSDSTQHGGSRSFRGTPGRGRDRGDYSGLTEKALEGAGSKRQQLKLLRKLKRKQEEEDGTGKQTRRKRFVDPGSDFGKNSLVYQMKHGSLKDLTNIIDEPIRPRSFHDRKRDEWTTRNAVLGNTSTRESKDRAASGRDGDGSGRMGRVQDCGSEFRDTAAGRTSPRESRDRVGRGRDHGRLRRTERSQGRDDEIRDVIAGRASLPEPKSRATRGQDHGARRTARTEGRADETPGVSTPPPRPRNGNMMPITIKYTTAASQFLYGRSVVKAALDHGRRKLYNLYIYGGENRQETKDIAAITQLAQERGVPITIVPNEDQRLMDKMSMGRPHNGFVLETSPLPQLPVASLGKLEESPSRLGFNIELGHQTKEDEAVNGNDTFIRRSSNITARPLVLLLNEIMDPGNLGAMLRTASYLGVDAVGITSRNSSTLTPVVLKSAAGAVEEVTIFTVDSPASFLEESKKAGWKSYAAVAPPSKKFAAMHSGKFLSTDDIERNSPLSDNPCILVLGNEGFGLSKQVKMAADYELSVPRFIQESCVDSLNVSVAAGLLCHAFIKEPTARREAQSKKKGSPATVEERTESQPKDEIKGANVMF